MKKATIVIALCILLSSCFPTKDLTIEATMQWYEMIEEKIRPVYGKDQIVQIWLGEDGVRLWIIKRGVNYFKIGDKVFGPMRL